MTVYTFDNGDRNQRIQDLTDEGTRFEFAEVVLVELFRAEILVNRGSLSMNLTAVPDKLDSIIFAEEVTEGHIRDGESVSHGQFCKGDIVLFLLSEFGLVKVGINELVEKYIDVVVFGFFLGIEPAE